MFLQGFVENGCKTLFKSNWGIVKDEKVITIF